MMSSPRKSSKEWFTLACRILGMWCLVGAFGYLLTAFDLSVGLYHPTSGNTLGGAMTHTFGWFLLALWLLKGAPKIADFFYPDAPREKDTDREV